MTWEPVIGLEIHLELETKSKMFCSCPADHFGRDPNTATCPTCLGLPGALPYPNRQAIDWAILLGMALGCDIPKKAKFDRKNYFYPDLPKGYQISQYDKPFCLGGRLRLDSKTKIRLRRVHLEEDTGKLIHSQINGQAATLIDFNRSGVPLVEIVTEPDFTKLSQLRQFSKKLRQIIRFLGISRADMEKGQMRLELNISLRPKGERKLPNYRVEVKNINSFRFLTQAAQYEISRQTKLLESGQTPDQETRGYKPIQRITYLQRSKEDAHDYRYFPEPDIPPFIWSAKDLSVIRQSLPKLPVELVKEFQSQFDLSASLAKQLVKTRPLAEYFQKAAQLGQKHQIKPAVLANTLINKKVNLDKTTPSDLVASFVKQRNRFTLEEAEIKTLAQKVIKDFPTEVGKYRAGKEGLLNFLLGQLMALTKGQAEPALARKALVETLHKVH